MDAPTCSICGKKEWRHICSGRPAPVVTPAKYSRSSEKFDRTKYQRLLMRKRRAEAKARERAKARA